MKNFILFIVLLFPGWLFSQQIIDTTYNPIVKNPEYILGKGPVVFIDQGHYNLHTRSGIFKPFANLLEKDGYRVTDYDGEFRAEELSKGKILVIANAINAINDEDWFLPTPSAFTKSEVEILKKWVSDGGSLFLIADHMPMAGAARELALEFGFEFTNGFVFDSRTDWSVSREPIIFNLKDKTLVESSITKGRNSTESVRQVATFTGQGFKVPADATPILVFNENYIDLMPDTAWVFEAKTPEINAKGLSQGAYKKYGKGKIVAFGEAGMFAAQIAGPNKIKMGMNSPVAPENFQLLLNIIHWLDGIIE
ncbi:MAG: DUF4350 domain-containing protein [Candidatus Neomarinimicrobiota bacterium]